MKRSKAMTMPVHYARLLCHLTTVGNGGYGDEDDEVCGGCYAATSGDRTLAVLSALFGFDVEEGSTIDNVIGGMMLESRDQGMREAVRDMTWIDHVSTHDMSESELGQIRSAMRVVSKIIKNAKRRSARYAKRQGMPLV